MIEIIAIFKNEFGFFDGKKLKEKNINEFLTKEEIVNFLDRKNVKKFIESNKKNPLFFRFRGLIYDKKRNLLQEFIFSKELEIIIYSNNKGIFFLYF